MGSSDNAPTQTPIQQQTSTREPWAPSQPFLQQALNTSADVFNQGQAGTPGYRPYAGQTMADLHPWQTQGQSLVNSLIQQEPYGSQFLNTGRQFGQDMITNQGLNAGMQGAAQQFKDIYNQASGNENPYLQALIEGNNRKIGDKVNAAASGAGRYASGAHTDVMSRALAEAANPVLAQDYQARQAQRQEATKSLADLYNTGIQTAGKFAELAPTLDQARFANTGRLMDLGQFYSARNQAQLNSDIEKYNAQQAFPWENLARYNAIASGAGGLGGTSVGGVSGFVTQPTTMQKLFGGAAAGAGLGGTFGGPVGAGVGALGGGLLGLL